MPRQAPKMSEQNHQQKNVKQSITNSNKSYAEGVTRAPTYEELGKLLVNAKFSNMLFTAYTEKEPVFDETYMSFLVFQREECPSTGRLHWQCYVEFKTQQRGGKLMKHFKFGPGVRESNTGTVELVNPQSAKDPVACARYCQKSRTSIPGTFKTFGEPKARGTAGRAISNLPTMPSLPNLPMEPVQQTCETLEEGKLRRAAYKQEVLAYMKSLKDSLIFDREAQRVSSIDDC